MNSHALKTRFLIIVCLILIIGLTATYVLVRQKHLFEKQAAGENSSLTMPTQLSVSPGQEFNVPIMINTDSADLSGVDIVLDFSSDKNKIALKNITPNAQNSTSFKTFVPVNSNGNFDGSRVINGANINGRIEFGAVTFDWSSESITSPFNGILGISNPFATLTFQAELGVNTPTQATINIVHTIGSTTDSNLVKTDTATDILANANSLTVVISGPTLTPTPTPTPDPAKASLTFRVKFQGVSGPNHNDKTTKVTLGQSGNAVNTFENIRVAPDNNGIYEGTIMNANVGTYDIFVKGLTQLQKKFENITLEQGNNNQDWSGTELLTGDTWGDNSINALDFLMLIENYFQSGENPADLNDDLTVNALDFLPIIGNYFLNGDEIQ